MPPADIEHEEPPSPDGPEPELVYSGAGIYAGAAALGAIETLVPGGPVFDTAPGLFALVMAPLVLLVGRHVPRRLFWLLGPIGTALIAWAVGTTNGTSDTEVLYALPVLWVGTFFGNRATAATVLAVAIGHGLGLLAGPDGNFDRWCDVTITAGVVAAVSRTLAARYADLVARLTAESRVDPLTGLLNRRGFDERFGAELSRSRREARPVAVVAVDIDHFKRVNDAHGHDAGDRALAWLASTLGEQTRGADITARVGGEEFLIVLPNTDAHRARDFAERLRSAVATRAAAETPTPLTVSVGVAASPAPTPTLLEAADQALYRAKREGRDRVAVAPA
jgi:diguanylate cyclase (GGDEF)-like protein